MLYTQPQFPSRIAPEWRSRHPRAVYLPNAMNPTDVTGNFHSDYTSSTATIGQGIGPMGSMRTFNFVNGDTTTETRVPTGALSASGGVTWIAVVNSTGFGANRTIAVSNQGANGGLQWRVNSSGTVMCILQTGISVIATDTIALSINTWYTLGFSLMNVDPGRQCTFAVNGVTGAVSTPTGVTLTSAVGVIGASASNGTPWAGEIALFACFDSVFTAGEMCEITANPWQMFADSRRKTSFAPSAGASIHIPVRTAQYRHRWA